MQAPTFSEEIPELLQSHFEHLHQGSGIAIDVIRERGYRSVTNSADLAKLGFSKVQCHVPGILMPTWGVDGNPGENIYRPDIPRMDKRGRHIKYENAKGSSIRLDCPPRCWAMLSDPSVSLWITEGIKKGDALVTYGLCTVVLSGVWGFKGKNILGGVTFLADWDHIPLKGRKVYIVYDSDVTLKPQVQGALWRLTEHLRRRGTDIFHVILTSLKGEKTGVDDYIISHSVDDLIALAKEVIDGEPSSVVDIATVVKGIEEGVVTPRKAVNELRFLPRIPVSVRRSLISQVVITVLEMRGNFIRGGKERYYFDANTKQLLPVDSFEFGVLLNEIFGLNQTETEFKYCLAEVHNKAHRTRSSDICQLAFYSAARNVLYMDRFDGQVYRLDGKEIKLVDNGTDDVLFISQPHWEPYRLVEEALDSELIYDLLVTDIPFEDDSSTLLGPDEQRIVLTLWLISIFFGSIMGSKPILVLVGVKGSGKTTGLRRILRFVFGKRADVIVLERDREDAFTAAITNNPIVVLDNLDGKVKWMNDRLATIATGGQIPRRKLYTTNELVEFDQRPFLAITARTPHFNRDDVVDRLVLLKVKRIKSFKPENELFAALESSRDLLWTELLRDLNRIVAELPKIKGEPATEFRMSDWGHLCWRIAQIIGIGKEFDTILKSLSRQQSEFLLEDDSFYLCLKLWLEDEVNHGREVSARNLYAELKNIADQEQIEWLYKSVLSLAKRVNNVASNLEQLCQLSVIPDARGRRTYVFRPEVAAMTG